MAQYWSEFLAFSAVHIFSLISPGPDFMMVLKNSTAYSRRTALLTALGIATGEITHILYAILGIGVLVLKYPWILKVIQYLGAAYLIYIGFQSIRAKKAIFVQNAEEAFEKARDLPPAQAFRMGFLTNALNAKASFFTISCFAVIVSPHTPLWVQGLYGLFIVATTITWFALVAIFLTHPRTQASLFGVKHWVERTAGAVLLVLGAKLAMGDISTMGF